MTKREARLVSLLLLALAQAVACGPPPFVVHVTFQGEVDVVDGSPVVYEGVRVGEVAEVALRQDNPGRRAVVAVTLEIDDPQVVLRERDRFHLGTHRGEPVIEIAPLPEDSKPLVGGAVVPGEPPLVTKLYETLGAAIESIGDIAAEALEEALVEMERTESQSPDTHSGPQPTSP